MHDGSALGTPLDALFRPRAVAVIGASDTPTKIGGTPVHYLRTLGYAGRVLPINPKAAAAGETIQGLTAYARVQDAPGPVDLAIVAVPAALTQGAIEDCAAAGVKGVVMFSAGFAEGPSISFNFASKISLVLACLPDRVRLSHPKMSLWNQETNPPNYRMTNSPYKLKFLHLVLRL